jgi:hypothetical protein
LSLLEALSSDSLLMQPKRISVHFALCIGRIFDKHFEREMLVESVNAFVANNIGASLEKMQQADQKQRVTLMLSHLRTILKQVSQSKLSGFDKSEWPLHCVTFA